MSDTPEYVVKKGISDSQIDELIRLSQSDHLIKKYTRDPKRFKNRESFHKWIENEKYIYILSDNSINLGGIIWFSKKDLPTKDNSHDYGFTFSIRIYSGLRGRGLAKLFSQKALVDFALSDSYKKSLKKGFWLSVLPENIPAINLYNSLGYKEIGNYAGRILMGLEHSAV